MPQGAELSIPAGGRADVAAFLVSPEERAIGSVLLVHDIFGRSEYYESVAMKVAALGFEAVLPDFYYELGGLEERTFPAALARRARLDEVETLAMFRGVLVWMRGRPSYGARIGTIGYCMGGTFTLDLSASEPDLATVSFYGFPIPQSTIVAPPPAPLSLVPEMQGPILAVWGDQDEVVGMENVAEFQRRAPEAPGAIDCRVLPGLGHSFFTTAPADAEGQEQVEIAWSAACAHLLRHVPHARQ